MLVSQNIVGFVSIYNRQWEARGRSIGGGLILNSAAEYIEEKICRTPVSGCFGRNSYPPPELPISDYFIIIYGVTKFPARV